MAKWQTDQSARGLAALIRTNSTALVSYAHDPPMAFRRVAHYVGRILKGANPIEQAAKFVGDKT